MRSTSLLTLLVAGLVACDDSTDPNTVTYQATLTGAAEVPPNQSTATGTWNGTLNTSTNILSYNMSWSGLGSNTLLAHIHGPAAAGAIADVLVDFGAAGRVLALGQTSGTGSGTVNLSSATQITATVSGDSLRKLLDAGQAYVNVHSATLTGGEIRGQITRQ